MAEDVGEDESELDSVTSSQKSFLKSCPFADPKSPPTKSSGNSDSTEILGNPISPPVVRTPVLSFSTPTSLDSINDDDVFRTPPENASLSSAADSEPRVRVSEMKPVFNGGCSKLKSPSSESETTPVSASPSLTAERNRLSDSVETVKEVVLLSSPTTVVADDVRAPGKHPDPDSPSPTATSVLENQPVTASLSYTGVSKSPSPSRVPRKHPDPDSPSPIAIGRSIVLENQPISDFVANTKSPSPVKHLSLDSSSPSATETENPGGDETAVPFKQVIEALLRNNAEILDERDEKVSYIDILKQCAQKFP